MEDSVIHSEGPQGQGRWSWQWRESVTLLGWGQITQGLSYPFSSGEGRACGSLCEDCPVPHTASM